MRIVEVDWSSDDETGNEENPRVESRKRLNWKNNTGSLINHKFPIPTYKNVCLTLYFNRTVNKSK